MIYNKPIDQIELADLEALVAQGATESKHLEFKQELNLANKQDKTKHKLEFLKDVSCFANAGGGLLIYGLAENEEGEASELVGLENQTSDGLKLQIESIIAEGIEPRITGLGIETIPFEEGKLALLIKIPKSWNAPHMVCHSHNSKFFTRTSAGASHMDVNQIGDMFLQGQTLVDKMRAFRRERVKRISEGNVEVLPIPFLAGPKLIVHFIPIQSFTSTGQLDLHETSNSHPFLRIMDITGDFRLYNFDGACSHNQYGNSLASKYGQLFRNGIFEYVETKCFPVEPRSKINIENIENQTIHLLERVIKLYQEFALASPYAVFISLVGIQNFSLWISSDPVKITMSQLNCNEIIIEHELKDQQEIAKALKPAFDTLWNAGGFSGSLSYKDDGTYAPR